MTGTSKLMNYEAEAQKETQKKKKNQEPAPVKEQVQAQAVTKVVAKKKFAPEKEEEKKINVKDAFSPSTLAWIKKEGLDVEKILKAKELIDRGPNEVKTRSKVTNLDEILSQQQAEKFDVEMKNLKLSDKEATIVSLLYKDKKDNKLKMNESTILAYHSTVEGEKKAKEAYAAWKESREGKEFAKKSTDKYRDISGQIEPMHITSKVSKKEKREEVEIKKQVTSLVTESKKEIETLKIGDDFWMKIYGQGADAKKTFADAAKLWSKEKPVQITKQEKPKPKKEPEVKKPTESVKKEKQIEKNNDELTEEQKKRVEARKKADI
jgi:hypothetical protein